MLNGPRMKTLAVLLICLSACMVGDGSEPLATQDIAQRHLPMLGAFGMAALKLCDRMGWDNRALRIVYDKTLRLWLEEAEPESSADLIDIFYITLNRLADNQ